VYDTPEGGRDWSKTVAGAEHAGRSQMLTGGSGLWRFAMVATFVLPDGDPRRPVSCREGEQV